MGLKSKSTRIGSVWVGIGRYQIVRAKRNMLAQPFTGQITSEGRHFPTQGLTPGWGLDLGSTYWGLPCKQDLFVPTAVSSYIITYTSITFTVNFSLVYIFLRFDKMGIFPGI